MSGTLSCRDRRSASIRSRRERSVYRTVGSSSRSSEPPEQRVVVVDDYLNQRRPDVTDGYGREPRLATQHGRVADSTIHTSAYDW